MTDEEFWADFAAAINGSEVDDAIDAAMDGEL